MSPIRTHEFGGGIVFLCVTRAAIDDQGSKETGVMMVRVGLCYVLIHDPTSAVEPGMGASAREEVEGRDLGMGEA